MSVSLLALTRRRRRRHYRHHHDRSPMIGANSGVDGVVFLIDFGPFTRSGAHENQDRRDQ